MDYFCVLLRDMLRVGLPFRICQPRVHTLQANLSKSLRMLEVEVVVVVVAEVVVVVAAAEVVGEVVVGDVVGGGGGGGRGGK